ncbi:hypothetical protein [Microbulbifer variabilis]|uniref:hypothetical protein n=1 Tax=Microbulbifer variabilis TaxID=266805 RepID=UPI00035F6225|nr:hypothetical protein [Microbulbifer variabilis]
MHKTAHFQQLNKVHSLCAGLEWVSACPDQNTRAVLVQLIGAEMRAAIQGVIYALDGRLAAIGAEQEERSDSV